MSDLLEAATTALGTPRELVQRSAAARAAADGTSVDDVLAAWSGGAPAPAPAKSAEPEPAAAEPAAETEAEEQPAAAAVAVLEEPTIEAPPGPTVAVEPEPEIELEPVPLTTRVRTAIRIGAWTGAALGVVGFLVSGVFWAQNATALPDGGPVVVVVGPNTVMIALALVSVVFGAVVAGMSRAATGWSNPAMELSSPKSTTNWVGAGLGLVLGVVGGAILNGMGTPVEGADPAVIQLPVLATLFVMIVGGAILGALTAIVPQLLGVPVAVSDDLEEVQIVKRRLGNAIAIPLAGLMILGLLVLPFAYTLIQSNHLAPGIGGAVVAVIAAGGILGFAALAGTKPEMRISFGDLMVALVGIGVVLVIIISVLAAAGGEEDHSGEPAGEAVVRVL